MSQTADGRPFMPAILSRLAPRLGATVWLEPTHEIVGHIQFPNGRKSYFWHNKFNLNSVASARIAQDKGYSAFFLEKHGFRVPRCGVFLEESYRLKINGPFGIAEARAFAEEHDWDVYLKPLRKSGGAGIHRLASGGEFDRIVPEMMLRERKVLLQEAVAGRDYRVVVLDGEVISCYERIPLRVRGDGRKTIRELISERQALFLAQGRDTVIPIDDVRIPWVLGRQGMSLDGIAPDGVEVSIFDVANLSCGGDTRLEGMQNGLLNALAIGAAEAMDLRFAGVDIIAPDAPGDGGPAIIEINSSPGLDHYGFSGPKQEEQVDELYMALLKAIERGPK